MFREILVYHCQIFLNTWHVNKNLKNVLVKKHFSSPMHPVINFTKWTIIAWRSDLHHCQSITIQHGPYWSKRLKNITIAKILFNYWTDLWNFNKSKINHIIQYWKNQIETHTLTNKNEELIFRQSYIGGFGLFTRVINVWHNKHFSKIYI